MSDNCERPPAPLLALTTRYELLKASNALSIYEIRTSPRFAQFYADHRADVDRIDALDNTPPPPSVTPT
jgi:hypothetical protein